MSDNDQNSKKSGVKEIALTDRREDEVKGRRKKGDRRSREIPVALDRRKTDRRLGERRRQIDPTTCEREYNDEEIEFMRAIEDYKRAFFRPFPTWSEVLEVLRSMGYRRVAEPTVIQLNRAKADAEAAKQLKGEE